MCDFNLYFVLMIDEIEMLDTFVLVDLGSLFASGDDSRKRPDNVLLYWMGKPVKLIYKVYVRQPII